MRRLAITPRSVAVASGLVLTLHPLDAAKLIQDVWHGRFGIAGIVVAVHIRRTVVAHIGPIQVDRSVRHLIPLAILIYLLLQALGILLVVMG